MAPNEVRTQVVLILRAVAGDSNGLTSRVSAAAKLLPLATVVLEPDTESPMTAPELAPAVEQIQALGIATLLAGDAALARIVKADGVHVPPSKSALANYNEARETLGTRFIVGIDVGRTRHDAMTVGEAGADYIAFGIPPHVDDRETARNRRRELIAWWSEIFEPPCVAFDVDTPEDARGLADAGADFIAIRLPHPLPPDGVADFLTPFAASLSAAALAT